VDALADFVHEFDWTGDSERQSVVVNVVQECTVPNLVHVIVVDGISDDWCDGHSEMSGGVSVLMARTIAIDSFGFPGGEFDGGGADGRIDVDTFHAAVRLLEHMMDFRLDGEAQEHLRARAWVLKRCGLNQQDCSHFVLWAPSGEHLLRLPCALSVVWVNLAWLQTADRPTLAGVAAQFFDEFDGAKLVKKLVACTRMPCRHELVSPTTSPSESSGYSSCVDGSDESVSDNDLADALSQCEVETQVPVASPVATASSLNAWLREEPSVGGRRAHAGGTMSVFRNGARVQPREQPTVVEQATLPSGDAAELEQMSYPAGYITKHGVYYWGTPTPGGSDDDEDTRIVPARTGTSVRMDELAAPTSEAAMDELSAALVGLSGGSTFSLDSPMPEHSRPPQRTQRSAIWCEKRKVGPCVSSLVLRGDTWVLKGALKHLGFRWEPQRKWWHKPFSLGLVRTVAALQVGTVEISFSEGLRRSVDL
jgi:hypothetical protein